MKKILITGKNSYIGTSVKNWLLKTPDQYEVDTIDLRNPEWVNEDFSRYDVIFHVAGIAHVSRKKRMKDLYFKVNTSLTIDVATKAKVDGVRQFIFMSSIIVYGSKNKVIDENTLPNPDNFYGESKLLAEKGLLGLESTNFKVAIIRPPMIYGRGSKGNYRRLSKFARVFPVFPDFLNQRSMLFIDNLSELIKLVIDFSSSGTFFPQNSEFLCTSKLVKEISKISNKRIVLVKFFNPLINALLITSIFSKIFGDLIYKIDLSKYDKMDYQIINFEDSVRLTEYE